MDAALTLALGLSSFYEGAAGNRDDDQEFNALALAVVTLAYEIRSARFITAHCATRATVTSPTVAGTPVHIVGAEFDGDDL
jgi:hypothetical protein